MLAKLLEKAVTSDADLSKLADSQGTFYHDLLALQDAQCPTHDSEVTLHDVV